MNICFCIDRWSDIKPETNSTLRMIHEAVLRGHRVALMYPRKLGVRDNVTTCMFHIFEPMDKVPDRAQTFYAKAAFRKQRLPVKGFDIVVLRADPPIDTLMLNFLDSVKDDTLIVNSIDGLRMANNKLYLTTFDDAHDIIPETYVSKDKEFLYDIIMSSERDKMIMKPIDGFGGSGVILLEKRAKSNIRSLLDFYIGDDERRYVIVQEYVESEDGGDVRVWMLNGEACGAYKRVPHEGDVRANLHSGGTAVKHVMTSHEKMICERVGKKLAVDGLLIAGLDIIGGKLIEVNVVSPGGIVNINKFNKTRLEKQVLDFLEQQHRRRESGFERKMAFKKQVLES
ncbi:MAG: glutathione synthetase [Elusimicrobia bacterium CG1_02_63_36]|nr:MAG: glutathione synthetase [Elusimicrobia bacterium CG1_02_63_36]PIP84054.1 MAG: glutathione synthetase [Elusimicrobia bacterium CG22_combo_CG10-13_8_21_14_all_63_91]PJA12731.1 MAG: glutathione synthetase [Elusimicrobia bacterium CG_4_10_14_0_2_um_filter_63_34]PJB24030.1 MAG: glutathione synthetase [Elusimicrobia bacterium CG_4_9_14_3_um_filter_62_55]